MTEGQSVTGDSTLTWAGQMQAIWGIMPVPNRIIIPAVGAFGAGLITWSTVAGATFVDRGLGLAVVGACFLLFVLFLPIIRTFSYLRTSPEQKRVTYEIDSNRIMIRDAAGTELAVPWRSMRWCRENSVGFTLGVRPMGVIWLPKQSFTTSAVAVLRTLVSDNLGNRAKLLAGRDPAPH
jgi:hypothetical protein